MTSAVAFFRSTSTVAAVAAAAQDVHTVAQLSRRSCCGRHCRMRVSSAAGSLENWETCVRACTQQQRQCEMRDQQQQQRPKPARGCPAIQGPTIQAYEAVKQARSHVSPAQRKRGCQIAHTPGWGRSLVLLLLRLPCCCVVGVSACVAFSQSENESYCTTHSHSTRTPPDARRGSADLEPLLALHGLPLLWPPNVSLHQQTIWCDGHCCSFTWLLEVQSPARLHSASHSHHASV